MINNGVKVSEQTVFLNFCGNFKIVVIKLDHRGDLITAYPAILRLKEKFNNPDIDIICGSWNKDLAESFNIFRNVYIYDFFNGVSAVTPSLKDNELFELLKKLPLYDIAIDLRKGPDTRFLLGKIKAKLKAGYTSFSNIDNELDICLNNILNERGRLTEMNSTSVVLQLIKLVDSIPYQSVKKPVLNKAKEKIIGLFPGAGGQLKQWPIEKFCSLADCILKKLPNYKILIYLAKNEAIWANLFKKGLKTKTYIDLNLKELIKLVETNEIIVGNNSFGTHLGGYLGSKVIGIYTGQETIAEWRPPFGINNIIYSDVSCSPCYLSNITDCPFDLVCLKQITVEKVCDELIKLTKLKINYTCTTNYGYID